MQLMRMILMKSFVGHVINRDFDRAKSIVVLANMMYGPGHGERIMKMATAWFLVNTVRVPIEEAILN